MKTRFKKMTAVWIMVCLIISMLQAGIVSAATAVTNDTIPNGEYEIDFNILANNSNELSVANTYMKIPGHKGKLIVDNNGIWFEHEVEVANLNEFEYLGYRPDGVAKAIINGQNVQYAGYEQAITRDSDNSAIKFVKYKINDISVKQDILMHINIEAIDYNNWYNAQLWIDISGIEIPDDGNPGSPSETVSLEMLNELITVSQSVYDNSVEGTDYSQYPFGSRVVLENAIFNARVNVALAPPGDEVEYGKIYKQLESQLTAFKALQRLADKATLHQLVQTFTKLVNQKAKDENVLSTSIRKGDYSKEKLGALTNSLQTATELLNSSVATQSEVDASVLELRSSFDAAASGEYVANEDLGVYVLDTNDTPVTESVYADDIAKVATTITKKEDVNSWDGMRADLTFNVVPDDQKVYMFVVPDMSPFYVSPEIYLGYGMPQIVTVRPNVSVGPNVYQAKLKAEEINKDSEWAGLGHIVYYVGGEKRSVYLSFNRIIHEELKGLYTSAKQRFEEAPKLDGVDQSEYDTAKTDLGIALEAAAPIVTNLNSERPAILEASSELQAAFDAFNVLSEGEYELYYTAMHATDSAFSSVDGYLQKPAVITPQVGGGYQAELTILDSSIVKELKVEHAGEYKDAVTVREDDSLKTKTVRFAVEDLASLVNAKVRIVTPYAGGLYDTTHDIRLNFNNVDNTELQALITETTGLLRTAAAGTEVGQYPAEAIQAMRTALSSANAIAANGTGTAALTAAALTDLQNSLEQFKAARATVNDLPDGDYSIAFSVLKGNTDETSMLGSFAVSPARLHIEAGVKTIHFTLKQSAQIPQLKVNDEPVGVTAINASANTREVYFAVEDLTQDVPGWTKFDWAAQNNYGEYDLRFRFASTVTPFVPNTGPNPNPGTGTGSNPVYPADGYYYVPFTVLEDGTSNASRADAYVVSPALVQVQGSSKTVRFVVKRSKEVHTMTINGSSGFDIQANASSNLRAVSYSLSSLSGKLNGTVDIHWPEYNYNNKHYAIQFVFDESSASYAGTNPSVRGFDLNGDVPPPGDPLPDAGTIDPKDPENPEEEEPTNPAEPGDNGNGPTITFTDTNKHWAVNEISRAVELGIVNGFSDGTFRPEQQVTRGEFAALLSRALGLGGDTSSTVFQDDEQIPQWAREHAILAAQAGFISGFEDGTFRAGATMTRAQLAVILARAAGLELAEDAETTFADAKDIPSWALREIAAVEAAELMQGTGNRHFNPNGKATRAQALTILLRLLDYMDGDNEQSATESQEDAEAVGEQETAEEGTEQPQA